MLKDRVVETVGVGDVVGDSDVVSVSVTLSVDVNERVSEVETDSVGVPVTVGVSESLPEMECDIVPVSDRVRLAVTDREPVSDQDGVFERDVVTVIDKDVEKLNVGDAVMDTTDSDKDSERECDHVEVSVTVGETLTEGDVLALCDGDDVVVGELDDVWLPVTVALGFPLNEGDTVSVALLLNEVDNERLDVGVSLAVGVSLVCTELLMLTEDTDTELDRANVADLVTLGLFVEEL